jgi:hypothetical protein
MTFMNTWEVDEAMDRHKQHPVLGPATRLLGDIRDLVNANSDGWAYWKMPQRAVQKLVALIQEPSTATEAKLKAAITPIKAFCTRHKLKFPAEALGKPVDPHMLRARKLFAQLRIQFGVETTEEAIMTVLAEARHACDDANLEYAKLDEQAHSLYAKEVVIG